MGRFRGRLGRHEGYALAKLADGSLAASANGRATDGGAYVAVCATAPGPDGIHWYGLTEYPPTEQGEQAAVNEWEMLHARHLLTTSADHGITGEVTAVLHRLDSLAVESPVAMVSELERVRRHTGELLDLAVHNARSLGTPWAVIAGHLGLTESAVRKRYGAS